MTPKELQAIRERAENATPGPWTRDELYGDLIGPNGEDLFFGADSDGSVWAVELADAIFASHARSDIPALLDRVDALTARLAAVRELHRKVTRYGDDEYSIPADEYLETPDEHPGLEPFDVCTHCMDIETTVQGDDVHWIGIESAWPCPTIQALEGSDD